MEEKYFVDISNLKNLIKNKDDEIINLMNKNNVSKNFF